MTDTDADTDGADSDRGLETGTDANADTDTDSNRAETDTVTATYTETDAERLLAFDRDGRTAAIAQNLDGYAMLKVRPTADGDELERYYGFDMALDHVGELLAVSPHELPIPDAADDMGM
ncbi:hypothetical protein OB955_11675 [Halobacteria archaeon AArc-m2/3/4]|uniref:Uncharacterized protein n=1 Tax=Natronoglomus mannanivorans TaxID=2979990 RepID=A0AAP2YXK2_9EURY|nr:hypothetical protein [Halobacteria archaeon AArc-xg1-1]MCU4973400.1 hypothetical protein [Halobacteria archaeon AArc-m2/3/4]